MGQHRVAVFHAKRHGWRENLQRLADNVPRFYRVRLEQTMEHLKDDALVNGELGDDVTEQQVAVVSSGRVDAVFTEEARPSKGHQSAKFVALTFVGRVVDVLRGLFN